MIVQDERMHTIIAQMLTVLPVLEKKSFRNYSSLCHVKNGCAAITDGFALLVFRNANITLPEGREQLILNTNGITMIAAQFPKYDHIFPTTAPVKTIEVDEMEKLHFFEEICKMKPTKGNVNYCLSFENNRLVYSNEAKSGFIEHLKINPIRAYPFFKALKSEYQSSYPLAKLSLYDNDCMIAQFGFSDENCFQLLLCGILKGEDKK